MHAACSCVQAYSITGNGEKRTRLGTTDAARQASAGRHCSLLPGPLTLPYDALQQRHSVTRTRCGRPPQPGPQIFATLLGRHAARKLPKHLLCAVDCTIRPQAGCLALAVRQSTDVHALRHAVRHKMVLLMLAERIYDGTCMQSRRHTGFCTTWSAVSPSISTTHPVLLLHFSQPDVYT